MDSSIKPIALGADDAGFELKTKIVDYLKAKGIPVEDYGVEAADPSVLYPDVALIDFMHNPGGRKTEFLHRTWKDGGGDRAPR